MATVHVHEKMTTMDIIRDSIAGQILRWATKNKVLLYPEEKPGFRWAPLDALLESEANGEKRSLAANDAAHQAAADINRNRGVELSEDLEKVPTERDPEAPRHRSEGSEDDDSQLKETDSKGSSSLTRHSTQAYTQERVDVERALSVERSKSIALAPTKTPDGTIVVEWYSSDDPANPHNWSQARKWAILIQVSVYAVCVYGASSMYAPAQEGVMAEFNVGTAPAALGLAIYVVGYGVGSLIGAPLSEIPIIGRNWVYLPSFFLFTILSIPASVVTNYGGLLVLRLLTGFLGSPCLSNGGASIGDMYDFIILPVYLSSWTMATFFGPALGPFLPGYAVLAEGWRWAMWEIVWFSAPILVSMFFFMPETSADNILLMRARRLRKLTGRTNIKSQSEINQAGMDPKAMAYDQLIKPIEIMVKDPAIAFANFYSALIYGIYYSFFEVFPLVYPPFYDFNLGEVGIVFVVTITLGCVVANICFLIYQIYYLIPSMRAHGLGQPERRLVPAIAGSLLLPIAYFLFGWTARPDIHWIVSLVGVTLSVIANFWCFQAIFVYLPLSYPRYAASLLASNTLIRALFAAACVMFSRPMFVAMGIGPGVSVLGGAACLGIAGTFYLWKYGGWLRSKSKFAQS